MNRATALRACIPFFLITALAAITGLSSQVEVAEVVFLISGSVCALLLVLGLAAPTHQAVPVRVRRRP
jgi:hypothetical protein